MNEKLTEITPIVWNGDSVRILDQRRLPGAESWIETRDYRVVIDAIRDLSIRGAPAIGIAGAYGLALAAMELAQTANGDFTDRLHAAAQEIRGARPTGANLGWAIDRLLSACAAAQSVEDVVSDLAAEAARIHAEDVDCCRAIGRAGAALIPWGSSILTHCNTGALATGGYGTALGVVRAAWADGRLERVYASETRPLLQGARLTAWELEREGINASLVVDSATGTLMRHGMVQAVIVGADRIARNGDVANKIGTYNLAVLAKENGIPFYVAAPTSTFDPATATGDEIEIEERDDSETLGFGGVRTAPDGVGAYNPAFDVTPNRYVTGIVSEKGIARAPYRMSLREHLG